MLVLASLLALAASSYDALGLTADGDLFQIDSAGAPPALIGSVGYHDVFALARDRAGTMWTLSGVDDDRLLQIDPQTGAGNAVASILLGGEVHGMAFQLDGKLLALVRPPAGNDVLVRIDMSTFASTTLGSTGRRGIEDICIAPEGKLYGWDAGITSNGIGWGLINPNTGAFADLAFAPGDTDVFALAIDEVGNVVGARRKLYAIDRTTGDKSATSPDMGIDLVGLLFDRAMTQLDGALAVEPDGKLWRINTTTGAFGYAGDCGVGHVLAMSFMPTIRTVHVLIDGNTGTEMWRIDPITLQAVFVATLPISNVLSASFQATGVLSVLEDGGPGQADLYKIVNMLSYNVTGQTHTGALTEVRVIADNPLVDTYALDDVSGLAKLTVGGAAPDVHPGPATGPGMNAIAYDPFGRLFGVRDSTWRIGVPSESFTAIGPGGMPSFVGLAFLERYAFAPPTTYCTSQTNSAGCVPTMHIGGFSVPSATAGSSFSILAYPLKTLVPGLFFYSTQGRNNAPFLGGFLCVNLPLRRCPVQNSNGLPSLPCDGVLNLDFNVYLASGADPALVPGTQVNLQCWSRDPASPSTTNLTNAVEFTISP